MAKAKKGRKRKKSKHLSKSSIRALNRKNRALWELIGPHNRNDKQRVSVIKKMNKSQFNDIAKLLSAFMSGLFPVSDSVVSKLKRDKKYLYALVSKGTPLNVKRKVLHQRGGFLPLLAAALAPALGALPDVIGGIVRAVKK